MKNPTPQQSGNLTYPMQLLEIPAEVLKLYDLNFGEDGNGGEKHHWI